jgi:two-component sensor histidine kinase
VVNELNHRVKNNLAMTQAIAAQTFRGLKGSEEAQANFTGRLMALAEANDLLTGERWVGASLGSVLEQALKPYAGPDAGRRRIEGPDVPISSKTALSLSLAAHELATNAVKHGAWSAPQGMVEVTWRLTGDPGAERLHLVWRESGGPPVAGPARRGFGSRLIERGLAAEMGGEARLDFRPDGLVCTLEAPLAPPGAE